MTLSLLLGVDSVPFEIERGSSLGSHPYFFTHPDDKECSNFRAICHLHCFTRTAVYPLMWVLVGMEKRRKRKTNKPVTLSLVRLPRDSEEQPPAGALLLRAAVCAVGTVLLGEGSRVLTEVSDDQRTAPRQAENPCFPEDRFSSSLKCGHGTCCSDWL